MIMFTDDGNGGAKDFVEKALNAGRSEEENPTLITLVSSHTCALLCSAHICAKDYVNVTEADFGNSFPVFSNARVRPSDENGRIVSRGLTKAMNY